MRRNSHQRKSSQKKIGHGTPPSWRLGFYRGTVQHSTGLYRGLLFWPASSVSVSISLSMYLFLTGDKGGEFWETTVNDECASAASRVAAFWVRQGGGREPKKRKEAICIMMGPAAMGPCLFDMCRSWVGWAAVAGVGQGPHEMM